VGSENRGGIEGQVNTHTYLEVDESPYHVNGQISMHILSLVVAYAQLLLGHEETHDLVIFYPYSLVGQFLDRTHTLV
jgi:hypothetical protein